MKGFVFLASPYSHPLSEVRTARFESAERACLHYFNRGVAVYSPIVHWHSLAMKFKLPPTFDAWTFMNDPMIEQARAMHIIELDGWLASSGVQHEIEVALSFHKPIFVARPFGDYALRRLKEALE